MVVKERLSYFSSAVPRNVLQLAAMQQEFLNYPQVMRYAEKIWLVCRSDLCRLSY